MGYRIAVLSVDEFLHLRDQLVDVYRLAFAERPYYRTEVDAIGFAETLPRHVNRSGFRALAALSEDRLSLDGFVYGYTSLPGQWWYDVVTQKLSPEVVEEWVTGSFEIVELAVKPKAQGQKLGSRLHDAILQNLPHTKAVLSTMQAETVALKLYLSRGWRPLIENFQFPGVVRPYQIMALDLKKQRES